jgi:hypothetical protein
VEKNADYLIVDHVKKEVPAGSYSWRWIEESVRTGRLLDPEDFSVGRPAQELRPVGTAQQKSTRTPFTEEDDLILSRFVTRHELSGEATSGNRIYRELEVKVRRPHTNTGYIPRSLLTPIVSSPYLPVVERSMGQETAALTAANNFRW